MDELEADHPVCERLNCRSTGFDNPVAIVLQIDFLEKTTLF